MGRAIPLGAKHVVVVAAALIAALLPRPAAAQAPPSTVTIRTSGVEGSGRVNVPGRPCADGGDGAYWHFDYPATLGPNAFGAAPAELRLHLDLHSNEPGRAFLLGDASHATLATDRGTVRLAMTAGSCATPALAFDGSTASGTGKWTVAKATGAYRQAAASGTFTFSANVGPGAQNPFTLDMGSNTFSVLRPNLRVQPLGAFWGNLGLDYVHRRVSVVYLITNTGPGDSFATELVSAKSTSPGVRGLGRVPQKLGDLLAGEQAVVTVRYQLGLLLPCGLSILNCSFNTTLGVRMPDALDRPTLHTSSHAISAPALPPPL